MKDKTRSEKIKFLYAANTFPDGRPGTIIWERFSDDLIDAVYKAVVEHRAQEAK